MEPSGDTAVHRKPDLRVGTERTVHYRVEQSNIVRHLMPGVAEFARKPEIMATGWLVGLCEWPAMDALRDHISDDQCSLGTRVEISHREPVTPGTVLAARARCSLVNGSFSEWTVEVSDGDRLVASGLVAFVVVHLEDFVRRKLPVPILS